METLKPFQNVLLLVVIDYVTAYMVSACRLKTSRETRGGGWREQKVFITEVIVCILSLC